MIRFIIASLCALFVISSPALSNTTIEHLAQASTPHGPVDAVAISPDGTLLATGGRDNLVRLWNVADYSLLRVIDIHSDWITDLAWHPNGTQLISSSRDGSVRVINARLGSLEQVFVGHVGTVTAIAVTSDGALLAAGAGNGSIRLYHTGSGQTIGTLENYGGAIWDLAFRPNTYTLAAAGDDGSIWFWGLAEGATWITQLQAHQTVAMRLAFAHDGQSLLTSGLDGLIHVWSIADTSLAIDLAATPTRTLRGHLAPALGLAFLNGSDAAISASLDGTVRVWDLTTVETANAQLAQMEAAGVPLTQLAVSPTGHATVVDTEGTFTVFNTDDETLLAMRTPQESTQPSSTVPDPREVAQSSVPTHDNNREDTVAATVPQAAASASTRPATPAGRSLTIPRIGLTSGVITFPIENRTWAIDPWEHRVGHFFGTAWVDQPGNVVLGGHSEYPDGTPGIFANLYGLGLGDEILLHDGAISRRYAVVNIREVDYRDLSVVYPTEHNRITLVTCDIPSYVAQQGIYHERLVIIADEVPQA